MGYWLDQGRVAGMVLSRVKTFTDAFVSGDGGGALWRRSPRWGHHCEAPCPLLHGALEGENSVHLWMCDGSAIGIVPSLETPHLRPALV